jgi:hypothetical protein
MEVSCMAEFFFFDIGHFSQRKVELYDGRHQGVWDGAFGQLVVDWVCGRGVPLFVKGHQVAGLVMSAGEGTWVK